MRHNNQLPRGEKDPLVLGYATKDLINIELIENDGLET